MSLGGKQENMFQDLSSLLVAAALSIGSATTALSQTSPQDYPQWRGQNRDGAASEFKEPKAWPEKLTPVLIGDTLFGLSERSSGQFFALDAKTGKTLWLGQPREASNTAVVKAGDLLFLLNDDAELIVARSIRTGVESLKRYTELN